MNPSKQSWLTAALYAVVFGSGLLLWQAWSTQQKAQENKTKQQHQHTTATIHKTMGHHTQLATRAPKSRRIHIASDTLHLTLDRLGGTIINAQLPQYKTKLHGKKPVTMLSMAPAHYRIAQAGSTGDGHLLFTTAKTNYHLNPHQNTLTVKLKATNTQGVKFTKTFVLKRGQYDIQVNETVHNTSQKPWDGHFYLQIKQKKIEEKSGFGQMRTFAGFSYATPEQPYNKLSFDTLDEHSVSAHSENGWIASQQHYFIVAWVPPKATPYQVMATHLAQDPHYALRMTSEPRRILPHEQSTIMNRLYIGPEKAKALEALAPGLGLTIDYGWLWMISNGLFWLLEHIHDYVPNWGIAIILLTLLIKLVFYQLSDKSFRSMAKMKTLQPKMEALKQQYADNKEALGKAMMELYKKEKVSPMGGCLPMLLQIPFFIALYWVLMESVELRHAPFFGWIQDLSAKDPYYILPVVMGLSMLWQQRLTPQQDPNQAKAMLALPVVFTAMFLSFPSGLVLYWLTNNLLSIAQQVYCTKKHT